MTLLQGMNVKDMQEVFSVHGPLKCLFCEKETNKYETDDIMCHYGGQNYTICEFCIPKWEAQAKLEIEETLRKNGIFPKMRG